MQHSVIDLQNLFGVSPFKFEGINSILVCDREVAQCYLAPRISYRLNLSYHVHDNLANLNLG